MTSMRPGWLVIMVTSLPTKAAIGGDRRFSDFCALDISFIAQ